MAMVMKACEKMVTHIGSYWFRNRPPAVTRTCTGIAPNLEIVTSSRNQAASFQFDIDDGDDQASSDTDVGSGDIFQMCDTFAM